jgi:crotonobetainyl-CoA:carnitine CoA-transferase CaiB-like acyl-CoA transferase
MSGESSAGLAGVRVVDFGHYIAVPLAMLLLAEAGADVVHVDSPATARDPGPADAYFNRSKRRITLDLKRDADRAAARELMAQADVVIENFRRGMGRRPAGRGGRVPAAEPALGSLRAGF